MSSQYPGVNCRTIGLTLLFVTVTTGAQAAGVTYQDIVSTGEAQIDYRNARGLNNDLWDTFKLLPVFTPGGNGPFVPTKASGDPGIAVFDYDRDGDLDLYVTNSTPLAPNSLYVNLLMESGTAQFADMAINAGVGANDIPEHLQSTGVCFGDIDNDGDDDLYVTGIGSNLLFENQGNGTFTNVTTSTGTGGDERNAGGCSFGDVNGDGLLDLAVANSYNWVDRRPLNTFQAADELQANQLFINQGEAGFIENGLAAGIANVNRLSWAVALVDIDQDGDMDLLSADDQGPRPGSIFSGIDLGHIRVYLNDGSGMFTDATDQTGIADRVGGWMGLAFGDLNHDGHLDLFATNFGNYLGETLRLAAGFENYTTSAWFFGQGNGSFTDPGTGALGATPFGWGPAVIDYDNDGDSDILYHGGFDIGVFVEASNPGAILENNGDGTFTRDADALAGSVNHTRRNVQGFATGDLNNDGFVDLVSASNMDWPAPRPLLPYTARGVNLSGAFPEAATWPIFRPLDPQNLPAGFVWTGPEPVDGTLAVELAAASNGNHWIKVQVQGSVGLASQATVNRSGIGAIIRVKPATAPASMVPVVSGGATNSSHALQQVFGLGDDRRADVEVTWPGGIHNKLFRVRPEETILFPEIPCDFAASGQSPRQYVHCVVYALYELRHAHVINARQSGRFFRSAIRAYLQTRTKRIR